MIDFSVLPYFLATIAVLVAIPGPNTIYVSTASASQGFKYGLASCLGIMIATFIHVSLAALGVTALLLASPVAFGIVKYLGALYLIYLGVKTFRSKGADGDDALKSPSDGLKESIKKGFLVNLLNPKTSLFIAAFLPQFVDATAGSVPLQILALGTILILVGGASDIFYAAMGSKLGKVVAAKKSDTNIGRYTTALLYAGLGIFAMMASHDTTK
jgi:threonine/homoserine/homoserine lactone efflux protein